MKKIIIIISSIIIVLVLAVIFFILYTNSKTMPINNESNNIIEKNNKIEDSNTLKEEDIEVSKTVDEVKENKESDTNTSAETKQETKPNNQSTVKDNSNQNNKSSSNSIPPKTVEKETVKPVEKTKWEELGISENDYYNKPMFEWGRIDYSIKDYGTAEKAKEACIAKGEEYVKQGIGYSCSSLNSYSGDYLGEMLRTF